MIIIEPAYEIFCTFVRHFFGGNLILALFALSTKSAMMMKAPKYSFKFSKLHTQLIMEPGRVAQSVTCLATDAYLTADPGVVSSIPARSHAFVEIDHEMISTVIRLPSADLFKKGCCQLQAKVCA